MKKIFTILAACAGLFLVSCNKGAEVENVPFMKGTFYAAAFPTSDVIVTMPGATKLVDIRALADTTDGTVASQYATINFKVEPELVSVYNKEHNTDYEMAPAGSYEFEVSSVMMPRYNVVSSTASIKVGATVDMEMDSVYVIPVTIETVTGVTEYAVAENKAAFILVGRAFSPFNRGTGVEGDPYMLQTAADLRKIDETLMEGKITYFKLEDDIDMSTLGEWEPINGAKPYMNGMYLDGDGHTLSGLTCRADGTTTGNAGLFSVLYGEVHNLNVTGATLGTTGNKYSAGIIAAYGGYISGDDVLPAKVVNCHVQGTIRSSQWGNGGICGRGTGITVERCSAAIDVESTTHHNAGIVGAFPAPKKSDGVVFSLPSTIRNCYSTGSAKGTRFSSGMVAYVEDGGGHVIENCYSTMTTVSTNHGGSGIVGNIINNTADINLVQNCIAWNDKIELTIARTNDNYSVGAIVGDNTSTNGKITLKNCLRKADLEFIATAPGNVLADMNDVVAPNLVSGPGTAASHCYPYHGKAVAAGTTCSQAAKQIGWDESVWDLSGEFPKLK